MNGNVAIYTSSAGSSAFRSSLASSTWHQVLYLTPGQAYALPTELFWLDLPEDPISLSVAVDEFADAAELIPLRGAIRTTIGLLPGEPYTLLRPIPVRIEQVEAGDFLAEFDEANIAISGETYQEAFQNLIAEILNAFENFSTEEASLGPEPTRQLKVLRNYLRPQR